MIAVVNYGLSNLTCVCSAIEQLNFSSEIVSDPDILKKADKIILPGVGAFGDAMSHLKSSGLYEALTENVLNRGVPCLGICLGAQLVCKNSTEFGEHEGFGWIDCSVDKIITNDKKLRVPHAGWDELDIDEQSPLLEGIVPGDLFYFTHSYGIISDSGKDVVAYCDYGVRLAAVLQRENICATQFHPEKSQKKGLEVLNNFLSNF